MLKQGKNMTGNSLGESVIGSEMEITGDVKCNGIMRVIGKLDGTINCIGLFVENDATINGTISARSVSIDGNVIGTVKTEALDISKTASFNGNLYYSRIAVDSGAMVEANLIFDPTGAKAKEHAKKLATADSALPAKGAQLLLPIHF